MENYMLRKSLFGLFGLILLVFFLSHSVNAAGPALPALGSAGNFAVLAETPVLSTGGTAVVGNIGISPCATSCITGFGLLPLVITPPLGGEYATSLLVTGNIYGSDMTGLGSSAGITPTMLTTATTDMLTAQTEAQGTVSPAPVVNDGAGNLGGLTLTPGIYKFNSEPDVDIASGDTLTLNCQGNSASTFIFQIPDAFTMESGATVNLIGNCQPQNIYWAVGTQVTLGTTTQLSGIVLAGTGIVMDQGATLSGEALSQGEVTLLGTTGTSVTNVTAPITSSGSSSSNLILTATVGIPCGSNAAPYKYNTTTGIWTALPFTSNTVACTITFNIPADPTIGIFTSTPVSTTVTTTISNGGGGVSQSGGGSVGGGVGGGVSGGGGRGSSLPVVISYSSGVQNGYQILNLTTDSSETLNMGNNGTIHVTLNYITPNSAGITANNQTFNLTANNTVALMGLDGYTYYAKLMNISYLPIQHTVKLLIYGQANQPVFIPANATANATKAAAGANVTANAPIQAPAVASTTTVPASQAATASGSQANTKYMAVAAIIVIAAGAVIAAIASSRIGSRKRRPAKK